MTAQAKKAKMLVEMNSGAVEQLNSRLFVVAGKLAVIDIYGKVTWYNEESKIDVNVFFGLEK